jgi:hypothetical protein
VAPIEQETAEVFAELVEALGLPVVPGSVNAALHLGFDEIEAETGWALTGTLAAAYGAPVAVRTDYPPDFYIPTAAILGRAVRLLGPAIDADHRKANIRIAPIPAICQQRIDPAGQQTALPTLTNEHRPSGESVVRGSRSGARSRSRTRDSRRLAAPAAMASRLVTDQIEPADVGKIPVVDLAGTSMLAIVHAIPNWRREPSARRLLSEALPF